MIPRRLALCAATFAVAATTAATIANPLPPQAHARISQATSLLPPGESGFVPVLGLASGSGSPHL